jgi:crotonobetainyl-CoA:carnitine CoA-transferase CaiB-like acyl-CoA transferase
MSITGQEDGEPTKVGVAVVDVLTGLHATVAILAALRARDTDGLGQLVEVNLLSSLLASLVNQGAASINGGPAPNLMGNEHPSIAPYETLTTKSGRIAVAVGNDRQFARFVSTIGLPTLIDDVRFASNSSRVSYRRELVAELEAALAEADADEWTRRLQAQSIPCGQVNTIREGVQLGVDLGLEPVIHFDPVDDEPAIATLASPLKLARNPVRYSRRPPALGADTDEVREWLLSPDAGDLT